MKFWIILGITVIVLTSMLVAYSSLVVASYADDAMGYDDIVDN